MAISENTFMAILALDAYNRGTGSSVKINLQGPSIGNAAIDVSYLSSGFFAQVYKLNGKHVLSYRGTDEPIGAQSDIFQWTTADLSQNGGVYTASYQKKAFDAFDAELTKTTKDNIVLTGHSLGGGLAGFIGSTQGVSAKAFQNIGYTYAANGLLTPAGNIYDEADRQDAIEYYYGTATPPVSPDFSKVTAFAVEDEVARLVRVNTPTSYSIGSSNAFGSLDAGIARHGQALMVIAMFAEVDLPNENDLRKDWSQISTNLWRQIYSDDMAALIGFSPAGVGGAANRIDKFLGALAYSAISEGTRPYGSAAIRSLFNDANDLGSMVKNGGPPATNPANVEILTKMLVQFAGRLAIAAVNTATEPSAINGVISVDPDGGSAPKMMIINLAESRWLLGQPQPATGPTVIAGRKEYITAIIKEFGSDQATNLFNDQVALASFDDNAFNKATIFKIGSNGNAHAMSATDAGIDFSGAQGGALLVGGNGNDSLVGGSGRDVLSGGNELNQEGSGDILEGGAGDDIVLGGSGFDKFVEGTGNDVLSGGLGKDVVDYSSIASSGIINISHGQFKYGGQTSIVINAGGYVDTLFSIEKIVLADGSGSVSVSDTVNRSGININLGKGSKTLEFTHTDSTDTNDRGKATVIEFDSETMGSQNLQFSAAYEIQERDNVLIAVDGNLISGGTGIDIPVKFVGDDTVFHVASIIGAHGEQYGLSDIELGTSRGFAWYSEGEYGEIFEIGAATLTIYFNDAEIVLPNWRNGDFGIHLKTSVLETFAPLASGFPSVNAEAKSTIVYEYYSLLGMLDEGFYGGPPQDLVAINEQNGFSAKTVSESNVSLAATMTGSPDYSSMSSSGSAAQYGTSRFGTNLSESIGGSDGADTIMGGAGSDYLYGEEGVDTYDFKPGDGADVITDTSADGNIIRFTNGYDVELIQKTLVPNEFGSLDLIVAYGFGDTVRISGWSELTLQDQEEWQFVALEALDPLNTFESRNLAGSEEEDRLTGSHGHDNLSGAGGNDVLLGNGGGDVIDGGAEDDTILGGTGEDWLLGSDGDDTIKGGQNDDLLVGGSGRDTFEVWVGDGHDIIDDFGAGPGGDVLVFQPAVFSTFSEVLASGTQDGMNVVFLIDQYNSLTLRNVVLADLDVSQFKFYGGQPEYGVLVGTAGEDILYGTGDSDHIIGDEGDDWLVGGAGADILDGGFGNDGVSYFGAPSAVTLDFADARNNTSWAAGDTVVDVELIQMSVYSDKVFWTSSSDVSVFGLEGDDYLQGGYGNDWLDGGAGGDILDGGDGWDIVSFVEASSGVVVDHVNSINNTGDAEFDAYVSIEHFYLSLFDDTYVGGTGRDVVTGGAGNDTISGGMGDDIFCVGLGMGSDIITDFDVGSSGSGDLIQIEGMTAGFSQLAAVASQVGADTVFDFNAEDQLVLRGVLFADLTADNFLFL